jgi:thioredoxin-like negative regulator of GroEL
MLRCSAKPSRAMTDLQVTPPPPPAPGPLWVACLCAGWCRTCDGYAPVFEQVLARLRGAHPRLHARWIDIEDEADLLGDFDIQTFPTLVVADAAGVRFAGPLTPQPETLERVLRAALAGSDVAQAPEVAAFAARLREAQA